MWRSGEALRPYFQDVLQLLRKLRELKAADPRAVPAISAPDATDFVHFPIVDCNVADDMKVNFCFQGVFSLFFTSSDHFLSRKNVFYSTCIQYQYVQALSIFDGANY